MEKSEEIEKGKNMGEEKSKLVSMREWIVEHKLRTVGNVMLFTFMRFRFVLRSMFLRI